MVGWKWESFILFVLSYMQYVSNKHECSYRQLRVKSQAAWFATGLYVLYERNNNSDNCQFLLPIVVQSLHRCDLYSRGRTRENRKQILSLSALSRRPTPALLQLVAKSKRLTSDAHTFTLPLLGFYHRRRTTQLAHFLFACKQHKSRTFTIEITSNR